MPVHTHTLYPRLLENAMKTRLSLLLAALLLAGCAAVAQRPVLYPNAKFKQVGDAEAQKDIAECQESARRSGASEGAGNAGRGAVQGAAVGAAASAVGSLIRGRNVVQDAAAGAAVGGAAGGVSGAFSSGEGSTVFKNFVTRCLRDKGYDVIGWN
jgi:outer membrane lipoprotein SlyB